MDKASEVRGLSYNIMGAIVALDVNPEILLRALCSPAASPDHSVEELAAVLAVSTEVLGDYFGPACGALRRREATMA